MLSTLEDMFDIVRHNICDPLSENPALHANIEFELEAILSIQVVSQLNQIITPTCHRVLGL